MKIAIIGCGYTGLLLAKKWIENHHITATTLHPASLKKIKTPVQKSLICKGNDFATMQKIINDNDLIIVTVATHDFANYLNTFLRTAQTIRSAALESQKKKNLIFTSDVIVYGEHHGMWVDETSPLNPITEQAKILIETEETFLSLQEELKWHVTLLRLGQIYGPHREISKRIKLLQDHILPGRGDHYTNMIHIDDLIGSIDYIVNHQLEGIFNITDDEHMIRKEFYDEVCKQLLLPPLKWDPSHSRLHNGNKRVSNHKIKSKGYQFIHPSRVIN